MPSHGRKSDSRTINNNKAASFWNPLVKQQHKASLCPSTTKLFRGFSIILTREI